MTTLTRRGLLAAPALVSLPARAQSKPIIVGSFPVVADIAAQIVGERAVVRSIVPPDTDPLNFQPTPEAIDRARGATLIVRNGLGLEPWLDRVLRQARSTAPSAWATERLTPIMVGGTPDPAAWQDAQLVRTYVLNIADALYKVMPSSAERDLRQGAAAMSARMARLDDDIRTELRIIPFARRVLVTHQTGLRYFSNAYDVRVVASPQLGPDGQVSPADLAALAGRVKAEGITALFRAPHGDNVAVEQLAAETGLRLNGPLYVDNLSPPDGPADTYEAMMRHNVRLMVSAMLDQ